MLNARSVVFNVLFYLNLLVWVIAATPTLIMPRRGIVEVAKLWARSNLWLLRWVCGIGVDFIGRVGALPDSVSRSAARASSHCEYVAE